MCWAKRGFGHSGSNLFLGFWALPLIRVFLGRMRLVRNATAKAPFGAFCEWDAKSLHDDCGTGIRYPRLRHISRGAYSKPEAPILARKRRYLRSVASPCF